MKYQFSFVRLNRRHWLFCEKRDSAELIYNALNVAGNTQIEVMENPHTKDAKWVHDALARCVSS